MRLVCLILVYSILLATTPFALAQTRTNGTYRVEVLVTDGKKSKEEKATLSYGENSLKVTSTRPGAFSKEFLYTDIKGADYSYSKKPLLSTGGAIVTAIFLGLLVLPFLFMKKKQHWLTVKTENDYAVMKLDKENFRQIKAELETHNVLITTVDESNAANKDKK
jgi:hypothetical protein